MRLLLDEMIPVAVAEQLRRRGLEVVAVAERPDVRSLPDPDVVAVATSEARAIVTRDRADYLAIDTQYRQVGLAHAGMVFVPSSYPEPGVGRLVRALAELLANPPSEPGFVHDSTTP